MATLCDRLYLIIFYSRVEDSDIDDTFDDTFDDPFDGADGDMDIDSMAVNAVAHTHENHANNDVQANTGHGHVQANTNQGNVHEKVHSYSNHVKEAHANAPVAVANQVETQQNVATKQSDGVQANVAVKKTTLDKNTAIEEHVAVHEHLQGHQKPVQTNVVLRMYKYNCLTSLNINIFAVIHYVFSDQVLQWSIPAHILCSHPR